MRDLKVDFEKIRDFFNGKNDDSEYINELFCDKSNEDELKRILRKQWYEMVSEDIDEEKDLSHVLYRIHYRINTRKEFFDRRVKIRSFVRVLTRVAAVLFLPLLIYSGIQFFSGLGYDSSVPVEIKAPAWSRVEFSLPDGTKGWLNSKSSISYHMGRKFNREVGLKGEAFFDVSKDEKRKFQVTTEDIIITVHGTRFNVASYDNENSVEVVLEEGSLSLSDKKRGNICNMKPGELVEFNKFTMGISKDTVQTHKYTSWKEGKLVFRNDPMDVVSRRLERWYNIDVEVNDIFPDDVRLRATFVDEDLNEILDLLKKTLKVNYLIVEGSIGRDDVYLKKKVILKKGD
ncbi:MAG: FecR family protein [Bacteroidales bacterium]